jgi:hypothetical protein
MTDAIHVGRLWHLIVARWVSLVWLTLTLTLTLTRSGCVMRVVLICGIHRREQRSSTISDRQAWLCGHAQTFHAVQNQNIAPWTKSLHNALIAITLC